MPTTRQHRAPAPRRRRTLTRSQRLTRTAGATATILMTAGLVVAATNDGPGQQATPASAPAAVTSSVSNPAPTTSTSVPATEPELTTAPATPSRSAAETSTVVPSKGSGRFVTAPIADTTSGDRGSAFTYTVEVEDTLKYDPGQVATTVDRTLTDRRGWSATTKTTFQRVAVPNASTRILLATPATVDRLCAPLRTNGQVSCRNGSLVVLNALRWAKGAPAYGDDVDGYRQYLINHEVGHRLGREHQICPGPGATAPLMVQQTKGLQGCEKNPWP